MPTTIVMYRGNLLKQSIIERDVRADLKGVYHIKYKNMYYKIHKSRKAVVRSFDSKWWFSIEDDVYEPVYEL